MFEHIFKDVLLKCDDRTRNAIDRRIDISKEPVHASFKSFNMLLSIL
jgi:hypothetical protein